MAVDGRQWPLPELRRTVVSVADGKIRPLWRGWMHAVAFVFFWPVLPALVLRGDGVLASSALGAYGLSALALYGASAGYHLLARTERAQWLMRRLDHSMIFVQIAGTYTPICLLALPPSTGRPLLVVVWTAAVLGVALKLLAGSRLLRLSNVLYLVVAWVAVAALPSIVRSLDGSELGLLLVGGVLYTAGALLFASKRPNPWPEVFGYHEVWHGFTVAAGLAHLALVWSVGGAVSAG